MLLLRLLTFLVVSASAAASLRTRTKSTSSVKSTSSTHSTSSAKSTSSAHSTSSVKSTSSAHSTSSVKSTSSPLSISRATISITTSTTQSTPHGTIILPLYISPTPSAWDPLYTSLTANPNLKFQVIVNPANGPGAANSYPDSDYLSGIPKLRSHPNAIPLCYVHTSYTQRAITDVLTDIQTCYNWVTYTKADIHMSGIFFDEAVAAYTPAALAYMTNITTYTRTLFGPGNDIVVFNPGEVVPSQWYSLADYIVAFEDTYAAYSSAVISSISAAQRPQSLFILYGFTGNAAAQQTLLDGIVGAGIGGLFITTVSGYTAWSKLLTQFCSAMNLA